MNRTTFTDDELHVGLEVPRHTARQIHRWADNQPWPEGTELEPPQEYHVTLLYSQDGHDQAQDAFWLNHMETVEVKLSGLTAFPARHRPEGGYAYVLLIDSPEVEAKAAEMQEGAKRFGLSVSEHPDGFKPHLTVAYGPSQDITGIKAPDLQFTIGPSSVSPRRAISRVSGELKDIMAEDCDYGDIWLDDKKKIVYLNIGDAFGDLIDSARDAAKHEYPGWKIEVLDEGARPQGTRLAVEMRDEIHGAINTDQNDGNYTDRHESRKRAVHEGQDDHPDDPSHESRHGQNAERNDPELGEFVHGDRVAYVPGKSIESLNPLAHIAKAIHEGNNVVEAEIVDTAINGLKQYGYDPNEINVTAAVEAWLMLYPEDDAKMATSFPSIHPPPINPFEMGERVLTPEGWGTVREYDQSNNALPIGVELPTGVDWYHPDELTKGHDVEKFGSKEEGLSQRLSSPQSGTPLYHWVDASELERWMDPSHTGPGHTYLTTTGDDPSQSWNDDVPHFEKPVRLTINGDMLDPANFDQHYDNWMGNFLYHGAIPQHAVTEVKSFRRPDEWDQWSTVPQQVDDPEDHWPEFGDPAPDSQKHRDLEFSNDWTY